MVIEASALAMQSPARTVKLLVAALACLAVALLPVLINRARRRAEPPAAVLPGTTLPYTPPTRTRSGISRVTVVGCAAAALFIADIWLPSHKTMPVPARLALPAASAIGPGVGIDVDAADGSTAMGCTAGFLVTTKTHQPAFLTAGHCNKPGGASPVTINSASSHTYVTVGHFNRTVNEGTQGEQHDLGVVVLDGDAVPQTSAITATRPVSGVTATLQLGQQLCKFGMTTNATTCGPIVYLTDSKVGFRAASQCGDSGGPVYLAQTDGTATAVGILIRSGDPNDPAAGCIKPGIFSAAELITPWLGKWALTPVTSTNGPTH